MIKINSIINKIHNADCMDIIREMPDSCIDLVITDCPYHTIGGGCSTTVNESGDVVVRGCGKCSKKWETAGQLGTNYTNVKSGKMFEHNTIKFEEWLPEIYRVLKDKAHCYIMINGRNLAELQTKAEQVGFVFQQLIVWDKGNATPNKWYMQCCEFILMLRKGGAKYINNKGTKNLLRVPNPVGKKIHPTEKPIELMDILIKNSSVDGDVVLDPFAGSSPVAVACQKANRNFICIEKDKSYYQVAVNRLQIEKNKLELF